MSTISRFLLVLAIGATILAAAAALAGPSTCGNGGIEGEEECDDGNLVNGDGCDQNCRVTGCGNGVPTSGEECDDGNMVSGDGCSASCELEICGDGDLDAGEECDDGNQLSGDGCGPTCQHEECGNGILDPGEPCDDGNLNLGDGCRPDCTVEVCGDAIVDPGEGCDDGNDLTGDGCRPDCVAEGCGDGILDPNEECDDGNTRDGDGCSPVCAIGPICGNGVTQPPEECDDGNTEIGDGCRNDCTVERCGDGVLEDGEECDDGNTQSLDGCSPECLIGAICGNGIIQPPELCDDGNTQDGDGCSAQCGTVASHTPSKTDQKCVNGINKSWAGVMKATNKVGGKCVKDISKGKVTGSFTDCAVAGDLGKAYDKTTKSDQKSCVGNVNEAMFGYIGDPMAVNTSATGDTLAAHQALLGDVGNIVPKEDKDSAKCQQEVQKGLIKYLDGLASDANKAKNDCLKGKKVAQCVNSTQLGEAMTVDGKKGTKALTSWNTKAGKKCGSLPTDTIPANFPGACASSTTYAELVACSAVWARCSFCATLNTSDGLAVDCDEYASSGNPGSCDPFVPPATTTVAATTTTGSGTTTTVAP